MTFDYIIVGAGVAGCTRASEICKRSLGTALLIEAGPWPVSRSLKIPSAYPNAFAGKFAWGYETIPQLQLAGRRIPLPAGKTLCGSGAINAMIFLRGH